MCDKALIPIPYSPAPDGKIVGNKVNGEAVSSTYILYTNSNISTFLDNGNGYQIENLLTCGAHIINYITTHLSMILLGLVKSAVGSFIILSGKFYICPDHTSTVLRLLEHGLITDCMLTPAVQKLGFS